ncbi:uroporphyrinogen decarboxylase [Anaeromyxobacter oryzae]|uniref:Uroporphyrinogen decarboxylase n=1 Tax=Anaeromyxobacter oryzae TaxID=2918170 RepID=A0ABN6MQR8_9BACT|nr:uroporphyrinogen decarboxylase [Anaeromyxobacter oryzae]BDG02043.1 uroporphyrinogen decarboxylase [Anaeromyxobacter oryzae]
MTHRFIAACRREPVDRIPVWMMRQAGRYQPSYRAVRANVSFLELCRSPELIAQVTLAPIDEFGFDAAILFSDILVHLPAMGLDLSFEKGEKGKGDGGPKIANPVRTRADVDALKIPDPQKDLPYVLDGVRAIRKGLAGRVPLIGFVGGPFTVASYVVEGGSQGFTRLKTMLWADPKAAHALFEKLTQAAIVQIQAQIAAGAEAAQIFESWLGELAREDLEEFAFPHLARIAEAVKKTGVPSIFFSTGTTSHLERIAKLGYDVISVDWRIPIEDARARVPGVAIQGNYDSTLLLGPKDNAVARAQAMLRAAGPRPGYIFNLGHGIQVGTPTETVKAVVDAVHAFTWK